MKSLLKALQQFNKICPPVKKNADNPFFKSSFASLDAIQHHIKPHLDACGLIVIQANVWEDGLPFVRTAVLHVESTESTSSIFPIIVQKQTPQEYGSAVSYAKRYSLSGLLNLIIEDEDDDGNASSQSEPGAAKPTVWLNEGTPEFDKVKKAMSEGYTLEQVKTKYLISKKVSDLLIKK